MSIDVLGAVRIVGMTVAALIAADLVILFGALLQIALEGTTGVWSSFWLVQARFFIGLISGA